MKSEEITAPEYIRAWTDALSNTSAKAEFRKMDQAVSSSLKASERLAMEFLAMARSNLRRGIDASEFSVMAVRFGGYLRGSSLTHFLDRLELVVLKSFQILGNNAVPALSPTLEQIILLDLAMLRRVDSVRFQCLRERLRTALKDDKDQRSVILDRASETARVTDLRQKKIMKRIRDSAAAKENLGLHLRN